MKRYWLVLLAVAILISGCGMRRTEPTYAVAGRIVNAEGQGVSDVTLVAQGANVIATTRPDGSWSIDGLQGRVTIVPHIEGSDFEPPSRTVTAQDHDLRFQVVPPAYALSGRVVNAQGIGVPGVVLTVEGRNLQVTTGFDGRWRIDGLREPVTLVPQQPGADFLPATRTVAAASENITFQVLHPILGASVVTREQARQWLQARLVAAPYLELVDLYYDLAPIYGIRPEVALAQAAHETGYFRFGNLVQPWQNNFAGIGATGVASDGFTPLNGADPDSVRFERGVHGAIFSTPAVGVEAHIQHLYAYATTLPLPEGRRLYSPRFIMVRRGTARYVEHLGARQNPAGVGWATDGEYGFKIVNNFLGPMRTYQVRPPF